MSADMTLAVTIPTRNRPGRLGKCLDALDRARKHRALEVYVGDSSTDEETRSRVAEVCAGREAVHLTQYPPEVGMSEKRNRLARLLEHDLIVQLVDDVYVDEEAIEALLERYAAGRGWRVVAGMIEWGDGLTLPGVTRPIGYERPARPGEEVTFLVGAFVLLPRSLAIFCPEFETVPTSGDRLMSALWRAKGVQLLFEPRGRATHDDALTPYGAAAQADHVYTNLFDSVIANPSPSRALMYELLGFAAGAKAFMRRGTAREFLAAWGRGHRQLARDYRFLKETVRTPLPPPPP